MLELKFVSTVEHQYQIVPYNRTMLELKLPCHNCYGNFMILIIVQCLN